MSDDVDFNELYVLLLDESRKAFRLAQEAHPDETFYAFGYNYKPWTLLIPAANTIEAHMRLGQLTEAERDNQTLEWFYTRWSPMDWIYYDQAQFALVNKWFSQHRPSSFQMKENLIVFDKGCVDCCLKVLKRLDEEGLFGHGEAREKVIINLMSPLRREEYRDYAYQLNSLPAYLQWQLEVELYEHAHRVFPLRPKRFERRRK